LEWTDAEGLPCARAFLGQPWPIRTIDRIRDLRITLTDTWLRDFHTGQYHGKRHPLEQLMAMDLAFAG
jgi:hypothetical protein